MIDFPNAVKIDIPEGEAAIIAHGSEILWQKALKYTLDDFTPGFVNSSTGAVEHNATYPRAIVSPLIALKRGKAYVLNSDLKTNVIDNGVRVRLYDANGKYVTSITNANLNNDYMTMTKDASSVYLARKIAMTAKRDCRIRIMYIDSNYLTTAVFKEV